VILFASSMKFPIGPSERLGFLFTDLLGSMRVRYSLSGSLNSICKITFHEELDFKHIARAVFGVSEYSFNHACSYTVSENHCISLPRDDRKVFWVEFAERIQAFFVRRNDRVNPDHHIDTFSRGNLTASREHSVCKCGHPETWHKPNDLHLQDAEKFCVSSNGVCSKRSCACCQFAHREVL
jgi:hypothetical protein